MRHNLDRFLCLIDRPPAVPPAANPSSSVVPPFDASHVVGELTPLFDLSSYPLDCTVVPVVVALACTPTTDG